MSDTEQQKYMVHLHTNENLEGLKTRTERIAESRRASQEAKMELLSRLPAMSLMSGSAIDINPQMDSIFPVVFVTTTPPAIKLLAADPIVEQVGVAPNFVLAADDRTPTQPMVETQVGSHKFKISLG
jgi:hypothetical protein